MFFSVLLGMMIEKGFISVALVCAR